LATSAGDLELRIPKLGAGSFFPSLLERRRRVDQALFAVVMEAYRHGVSTGKVDDLVRALGADSGISKSEVSRICADLDGEVSAFRDRSLAGQVFPYGFVDATSCKARVNRRVVAQAVVVARQVPNPARPPESCLMLAGGLTPGLTRAAHDHQIRSLVLCVDLVGSRPSRSRKVLTAHRGDGQPPGTLPG
jgi:Transposase, Mutator family